MKVKIKIQLMIVEPKVFPKTGTEELCKICPYCGQSKIPFKMGICICGKQVGNIRYVKNVGKFGKGQYYSYVG
jgi:hypothetical protein